MKSLSLFFCCASASDEHEAEPAPQARRDALAERAIPANLASSPRKTSSNVSDDDGAGEINLQELRTGPEHTLQG